MHFTRSTERRSPDSAWPIQRAPGRVQRHRGYVTQSMIDAEKGSFERALAKLNLRHGG